MNPWEQPWWVWARLKELVWTSLGTVQMAFWLVLGTVLYLAIFTNRSAQVVAVISALMPLVLGLAATYTARRLGSQGIEAKFHANSTPDETVVFQPGQDDPTR